MNYYELSLSSSVVGETGVSWHVFQKNAHKTQESLLLGMSDVLVSEKVEIYVTNSRYKNVQAIYDYLKKSAVN